MRFPMSRSNGAPPPTERRRNRNFRRNQCQVDRLLQSVTGSSVPVPFASSQHVEERLDATFTSTTETQTPTDQNRDRRRNRSEPDGFSQELIHTGNSSPSPLERSRQVSLTRNTRRRRSTSSRANRTHRRASNPSDRSNGANTVDTTQNELSTRRGAASDHRPYKGPDENPPPILPPETKPAGSMDPEDILRWVVSTRKELAGVKRNHAAWMATEIKLSARYTTSVNRQLTTINTSLKHSIERMKESVEKWMDKAKIVIQESSTVHVSPGCTEGAGYLEQLSPPYKAPDENPPPRFPDLASIDSFFGPYYIRTRAEEQIDEVQRNLDLWVSAEQKLAHDISAFLKREQLANYQTYLDSTNAMAEATREWVKSTERCLAEHMKRASSPSNLTPPPNEFYCPITLEMMEHPVVAADGHSYEKSAIDQHFQRSWRDSDRTVTSPLTNMRMKPVMMSNFTLRSMIQRYKSKNDAE